ncbi:MAG TPA: hypothetical protein VFX30_11150 [bacterium]|nr:hypothetical protein [bacterium]
MKRDGWLRVSFWFLGLAFLAALQGGGASGCGSAAGSSPPVGIPAPVAGLIATTSPDAAGVVRMTGAPGAVQGGATVNVSLETPAGLTLKDQPLPQGTGANFDGSFVIDFDAGLGDVVRVTQSVTVVIEEGVEYETVESAPIFITILDGRTLLASAPAGAAATESFSLGCVLRPSFDGQFLDCFSPSTLLLTDEFDLAGVGFPVDLALDDTTGDAYVADTFANGVGVYDPFGGLKADVTVTAPVAVASDLTKRFAVAGLQNASPNVAIVDNTAGVPANGASFTILHPTNGSATANRTFAVSLDQDTGAVSKLAALTEFSNGDTVFSVLTVIPPPGGAFTVDSQVNLGAGTFDSVVLYNDAAEALVTDSGGNRVLQLQGSGFATQNVIAVGADPRGVAVSEARQLGFVCNRAGHTVSIVDLGAHDVAGTMTTSQGVGLGPTDIAVNPSPFTGLISNPGDSTVTLFNVDDILAELGIP